MNSYLIKYKIATVAELENNFSFDGYDFTSFTPEWWSSEAWVASKIIKTDNGAIAIRKFMNGLIPIIEKCSVVSQCAFRIIANSYVIYKQTNNPEKIVYIYYVRKVGHTGLSFGTQELEQLTKINFIPNKKGLFFIMEAANSSTFYTRLSMLLAAAEGLAGEVKTEGKIMTNKKELSEILGQELYKKLYAYGTGLRHKLLHGNIQAHNLFDGLTEQIYLKLMNYLKNKFNIQFEENVVHPQRNFNENYESARTFEKLKDEVFLDLRLIEEAFDYKNPKQHETERQIFDGYVKSPENY